MGHETGGTDGDDTDQKRSEVRRGGASDHSLSLFSDVTEKTCTSYDTTTTAEDSQMDPVCTVWCDRSGTGRS